MSSWQGQCQNEGKQSVERVCAHMQPVFGDWDLTPDQIPTRLLLNLLVGAGAVCTRCRHLALCIFMAISFLAAAALAFFPSPCLEGLPDPLR